MVWYCLLVCAIRLPAIGVPPALLCGCGAGGRVGVGGVGGGVGESVMN